MYTKFHRTYGLIAAVTATLFPYSPGVNAHGPATTAVLEYDDLVACTSGLKTKTFPGGTVPHKYLGKDYRPYAIEYNDRIFVAKGDKRENESWTYIVAHPGSFRFYEVKNLADSKVVNNLNWPIRYVEATTCQKCQNSHLHRDVLLNKGAAEPTKTETAEMWADWDSPCPNSKSQTISKFWIPTETEARLWQNLDVIGEWTINYASARIRDANSLDKWKTLFPGMIRRATTEDIQKRRPDLGEYIYINPKYNVATESPW